MALWMIRAGRRGEYEDRFITDSRVYLTWGDTFQSDLRSVGSRAEITRMFRERWVNLVVVPSKKTPELHFGVIRTTAEYDATQTRSTATTVR